MNIEEFRAYCLSFEGVHDDFPFGRATSEYDRNLLVFYVGEKWFCFVNAVEFDCCTIKCAPERIAELQERYEGIVPGYHMNKRHWISVRFDSDVPEALVRELVRASYEEVAASLKLRIGVHRVFCCGLAGANGSGGPQFPAAEARFARSSAGCGAGSVFRVQREDCIWACFMRLRRLRVEER